MPLPNPGMSFTPFDPLPASDLNDIVENIEAIQDGSSQPVGATGSVVQSVSTMYTSSATTTTQIPFDNTIPQITEGAEFMTQAITPKSATNKLIIEVTCLLSSDTASRNLSAALFQGATANALAAGSEFTDDSATLIPRIVSFKHVMVAGTTSAITFRVRGGANSTGTTTFNGFSGGGLFGAITKSSIVITEVKA